MPAADRPSRATPGGRVNGTGSSRGGNGRGTGHANGRGGGNPVVPARREQRIERSPATVVRQAGEVRGRARPVPVVDRDDSWSSPPDPALPVGPASPDLAMVIDAEALELDGGPTTSPVPFVPSGPTTDPVPLGDITYARVPTLPGVAPAQEPTIAQPLVAPPPIEMPPVPATDPATDAAADAVAAAPVPGAPERPRRSLFKRRTRIRKVSRVVRRVDAWSVLKISLIFYALAYVVLLVAGVLLWNLAQTTGTVENIEGFVRELFGLAVFEIDGERLYRASWPIGVFLAVAGTGLNVTAAVMFNLITDLVGGVRVTVLEEEVRVVESGSRTRRGRRAGREPAANPQAG